MANLLSTGQAAERLGVTRQTVRNMVYDGRLKAAQSLPNGYLFSEAAIARAVKKANGK